MKRDTADDPVLDSSAPVRPCCCPLHKGGCSPYAEPPDVFKVCQSFNEVGLFPSLIRWPTLAIPVSTVSLASKNPSRRYHTTHYQKINPVQCCGPVCVSCCSFGGGLCFVLQLLVGGCVSCCSFWRGAVLRVTATLEPRLDTLTPVSIALGHFWTLLA